MRVSKPGFFSGLGALCIGLAIVLGAWNAHGMEQFVSDKLMSLKYLKTFHTGVEYMFLNATGLLILGFITSSKWIQIGRIFIFCGMVIFSGSLFFLSFHEILGNGFKFLGAVAPFGGLFMAAGWVMVAIGFFKNTHE